MEQQINIWLITARQHLLLNIRLEQRERTNERWSWIRGDNKHEAERRVSKVREVLLECLCDRGSVRPTVLFRFPNQLAIGSSKSSETETWLVMFWTNNPSRDNVLVHNVTYIGSLKHLYMFLFLSLYLSLCAALQSSDESWHHPPASSNWYVGYVRKLLLPHIMIKESIALSSFQMVLLQTRWSQAIMKKAPTLVLSVWDWVKEASGIRNKLKGPTFLAQFGLESRFLTTPLSCLRNSNEPDVLCRESYIYAEASEAASPHPGVTRLKTRHHSWNSHHILQFKSTSDATFKTIHMQGRICKNESSLVNKLPNQ